METTPEEVSLDTLGEKNKPDILEAIRRDFGWPIAELTLVSQHSSWCQTPADTATFFVLHRTGWYAVNAQITPDNELTNIRTTFASEKTHE